MPVVIPEISLPTNISTAGSGETFQPNSFTGTADVTVPLFCSPARGAEPQLALRYTSGGGNGVFGLGFRLPVPSVSRRTELGVPRYAGDDTFVLDSGDFLVPRYGLVDVSWLPAERTAELDGRSYHVVSYRRGVESTFDVIEWWTDLAEPVNSFWQIIGSRNERTVLGRDPGCRIADPASPGRVWRWLVEEQSDAHGNRTVFEYTGDEGTANRYLTRVGYGPYRDSAGTTRQAFAMVFDYGERSSGGAHAPRPDPFSSFRPGFEVRTDRLCRAVLVTHHLPEALGPEPVVVSETRFDYGDDGVSLLRRIERTGRRDGGNGQTWTMSLPAMTFGYTRWEPENSGFRDVAVRHPGTLAAPFGDRNVQLVDLDADGMPGVLTATPGALLYSRPLGTGTFAAPTALAVTPEHRPIGERRVALADITGTGRLDLVVAERMWGGYYANEAPGWRPFEPFRAYTPELHDTSTRLVDLSGDGRPDLLSPDDGSWRVTLSTGPTGFTAPVRVAPPPGVDMFDGGGDAILVDFANVFGDGLSHLVRVSDGRVEVWPSLGYGRFGDRREIPGAPRFGPTLTASRVLFADVDGDGTDDLVVVLPDRVELYRNRFGRGFDPPVTHPLPDGFGALDRVQIADILGRGTAAVVVSRAVDCEHRYLDYAGDGRPYLLSTIHNGLGAVTRIEYRSSTEYSLADRAAGRPWATALPFPVPVVARVESVDPASGTRLHRVFQYRDGYFDPIQRRFCGFGFVQAQDRPSGDGDTWHFPVEPAAADDMASAARQRRTWSHTGAYADGGRSAARRAGGFRTDPDALVLPDAHIDPAITALGAEADRQAWQALSGTELRFEEYGVDPAGRPDGVPYRVGQSTRYVRLVQPPLDGHPGVYQVVEWEKATSDYDRDPGDPRTEHRLNVRFDDFGHPLCTALVAYRRRPAEGRQRLPEQRETRIHLRTAGVLNHVDGRYRNGVPTGSDDEDDGAGFHLVGLEAEETRYWLSGFAQPDGYLDHGQAVAIVAESLSPDGGVRAHLVGCWRDLFWDGSLTAPLPLLRTGPQALMHHRQTAVLPDALVTDVYGDRVGAETLRDRGGYRHEDGCWWSWDLIARYEDGDRYYLERSTEDPFGGLVTVGHDDYALAVTSRTDALGQTVTASTDYYTLRPMRVVDVNGNVSEALYDPLGRPMVSSRHGVKDGRPVGDEPLADYDLITGATAPEVLADPLRFVQGAGVFTIVDLAGGPARTVTVRRRHFRHPEDPEGVADDQLAVEVSFLDAFLRPLGTAARQAADAAAGWVFVDAVRYDDRGEPVRRYLPYRAGAPDFEVRPPAPCWQVRYDALGREVEAQTPDGFLTRTLYTAWSEAYWDQDDTVLDSPYYREHAHDPDLPPAQRQALDMAVRLRDTPTVQDLDVLGRTVQVTTHLVDPDGEQRSELREYRWLNARGDVIATADPRFTNPDDPGRSHYYNTLSVHDLTGHVISTRSCDVGDVPLDGRDAGVPTVVFHDALGAVLDDWDPRGYHVSRHLDVLRRPVRVRVTGGGLDQDTERVRYGSDPEANTVDREVERFDQAGVLTFTAYSLTGGPAQRSRRYRVDDSTEANWDDPARVPLAPRTWWSRYRYDALGALASVSTPAGVDVLRERYDNGWVRTVSVRTSAGDDEPVIAGVEYRPQGAPAVVRYGDRGTVAYRFSDTNQRLVGIVGRVGDEEPVLDLAYTYDPVGNVTHVANASVLPGSPAPDVDGSGDFRYDSLYRLRSATGRQATGLTSGHDRAPTATPLERYAERYEFDHSGNLTRTDHLAELGWSEPITVAASSNHGVPAAQADDRSPDDFYDAGGNLTALPTGAVLGYDHIGRMTSATLDGTTTRCQYDHTGTRVRRTVDAEETLYLDDLIVERGEPDRFTLRVVFGGHLAALFDIDQNTNARIAGRRYQLADRLGSVAYELDGDGNVVTCEEYLPFGGNALLLGEPDAVATKRYRFGGKELDPTTGLYDYGRRYYLPGQGRWTTPDPAGEVDGLNLFAYVRGNPVTVADPTGEAGDTNETSTKPIKKANTFLTMLNAMADSLLHWEPPIATIMRNGGPQRGMPVFPFTRMAAFGASAGGLTGSIYYGMDIRKYGANFYNVTSLLGNLGFMVEGGLLYRTLLLSGHSLHNAHMVVGRFGAGVDVLKIPKAIKDKDYFAAVSYGFLGLANARTGMSDQHVAALSRRGGPVMASLLQVPPNAMLAGVVAATVARAVASSMSRDHPAQPGQKS